MSPAMDYARVARLYDAYARFEDDIPFFLEECRGVEGPVLELMSGTGRVSLPLVEAGVELTCVDSSPQMLAVLREKLERRGLAATLVARDVARLEVPEVPSGTFPLALLPFHSFAELLTDEDQRAALAGVRRALAPGGRFLCPLHNPAARLRAIGHGRVEVGCFSLEPEEAWDGGRVRLWAEFEAAPAAAGAAVEVRGTQTVERLDRDGEIVERIALPIRFLLHRREGFEALAREAGFAVEHLWGDYRRAPFEPEESPFLIWRLVVP